MTELTNKSNKYLNIHSLISFLILSFFSVISVAEITSEDFDHLATGYRLTAAHRNVECKSCHVRGIFKSTPKECSACHANGSVITAFGKPANHVISSDDCESCHGNDATNWSTLNIKNHDAIVPGNCESCHNAKIADGKNRNHIPSNNICDDCHRTQTWAVSRIDHSGFSGPDCLTCHNGAFAGADGKSSNHVPTNLDCDSCHTTTNWDITDIDHTIYSGPDCAICHTGSFAGAQGRSPTHVPIFGLDCDVCHTSTDHWSIP